MNVFVTGATGFLGRHLTKALKADGVHVTTLHRPWTYASIVEQFYRDKPDVVVHLAAYYRAEHKSEDIGPMIVANVGLPTVLYEAMRARGMTQLVTTGTAWQDFNGRNGVPANLYAATKSAADAIVAYYVDAHGFRVANLRLINLYGADDTRKTLLATIHDGMDLTAGEQETAFVPVEQAVDAIRHAIDHVHELPRGMVAQAAVWGTPRPLRELVTEMRPELTLNWGALPYRPREMMSLPTHLPQFAEKEVLA